MYYSKKDYQLVEFKRGTAKYKKYKAILENIETGSKVSVHFGDVRYQQYKDSTGMGLYTRLNHGDDKRRKNYRSRHKKHVREDYYSPSWFSYYYLW